MLGQVLRSGYLLLGLQLISFGLLVVMIGAGLLQPDATSGITLLLALISLGICYGSGALINYLFSKT